MKRIIMSSAAIILLVAGVGAAEAQQWQGQNGPGGRGGGRGGPAGLAGQQAPQQQQQVQPRPQQQPPQQQVQGPGPGPGGPGGPRGDRNRDNDRRDNNRGGWHNNDRGERGWNNGGQRHRAGRYYAPRGHSLRIWSLGQILPSAYWGGSYVIRDYWRFGLPRPYAGAQWVRSGDDALMIDRRGRIIEVARNLFW